MNNCVPCGACRQVMSEFASDEGLNVITQTAEGIKIYNLNELLPESFEL